VRTIQEHGKEETIGAVFSIRTADASVIGARQISEHEKIVKVTEYVEFAAQREQDDEYCYFVVMEHFVKSFMDYRHWMLYRRLGERPGKSFRFVCACVHAWSDCKVEIQTKVYVLAIPFSHVPL